MKKILLPLLAALPFALSASAVVSSTGCGGGTEGTDGGTDAGSDPTLICDASPDTTITMTKLQTQVFDPLCKSCHFPPNGSGIAYGDYTTVAKTFEMVGKKSLYAGSAASLLIVDGTNKSLANSTLWLKISPTVGSLGHKGPKGEATGAKMPNDGAAMSAQQLKAIKDWICIGAPM